MKNKITFSLPQNKKALPIEGRHTGMSYYTEPDPCPDIIIIKMPKQK